MDDVSAEAPTPPASPTDRARQDNRRIEDEWLLAYWQERGGLLYAEVPVGRHRKNGPWPRGSRVRRIDAIRILGADGVSGDGDLKTYRPRVRDEFTRTVRSSAVELIEVKRRLNRPVIGQVIAGALMFAREYGVESVGKTIVCEIGDPALELVCPDLGIEVWRVRARDDFQERA